MGNTLSGKTFRKRNFTTFGGQPCITVEELQSWSMGKYRINNRFVMHPDDMVELSAEDVKFLQQVWDDSGLVREHVQVEGRIPCSRADGIPKQPVPEKDMQAKLFEIRMRRGDLSFQAYRCPDCNQIHIGRNPSAPKDRILKNEK